MTAFSSMAVTAAAADAYADGEASSPVTETRGGPVEYHNASWDISNAVAKTNMTIWMNANLTVKNGGTLTLKNVTMVMNCSFDGQYVITVNSGGKMYVMDLDGDKDTWYDSSHITNGTANKRWRALEESGGRLDLVNSEFDHAGWSYNDKEVGLQFYGSDVLVTGSRIHTSWEGLSFWWPYHTARNFTVKDCWINNTNLGIFIADKTSVNITNTIIENSSYLGLQIYAGTLQLLMDRLILRNNNIAVYNRYTSDTNDYNPSNKNILTNSTISGSTLYDIQITGAGHLWVINSTVNDAKVSLEDANCWVRYFSNFIIKTTTATDFPYPYSDLNILIDGGQSCTIPRFASIYTTKAHTDYNGVSIPIACYHSYRSGGGALVSASSYSVTAQYPWELLSNSGSVPTSFSTAKVIVLNHARFYVLRDLEMKDMVKSVLIVSIWNGTLKLDNSTLDVQWEIGFWEESIPNVHAPSTGYGRILAINSSITVQENIFIEDGIFHLINSSFTFDPPSGGWGHGIVSNDYQDYPATIILEDYDNDPATTEDASYFGAVKDNYVSFMSDSLRLKVKNSKFMVADGFIRNQGMTKYSSLEMDHATLGIYNQLICQGCAIDIKDSEIVYNDNIFTDEKFIISPGILPNQTIQSLTNVTVRGTIGHGLWVVADSRANYMGTTTLNGIHFKDNPNYGDALMIQLSGPDQSSYIPDSLLIRGLTFDNISGNYIEVTQSNNNYFFSNDAPLTFYECDITDAGSAGKVVATTKASEMYLSFVNSTIAKNDIASVPNLKVDIVKNVSVLAKNTLGGPLKGAEYSLDGPKTGAAYASTGLGGSMLPTGVTGYSGSMSFLTNQFKTQAWTNYETAVNMTDVRWSGPLNTYEFKNVPRNVTLNNPYTLETVEVLDKVVPTVITDETPSRVGTGNTFWFAMTAFDELGIDSAKVKYWPKGNEGSSVLLQMVELDDEIGNGFMAQATAQLDSVTPIEYTFTVTDWAGNMKVTENGTIEVYDDDAPTFITDRSPTTAELEEAFVANADFTDNIGVSKVILEYEYLGGMGTTPGPTGLEMTELSKGSWTAVIDMPSGYTGIDYFIVASDAAGNENVTAHVQVNASDSKAPFDVTDITVPKKLGGETMTFGALVQDKVGISRVWTTYWWENENVTLLELKRQGAHYIWDAELVLREEGGVLHYIIWANDTSNNTASTTEKVIVVDPMPKDTTPPMFVKDLSPQKTNAGSKMSLMVLVIDDTAVKNVSVEVKGALSGTFQMLGGPIYEVSLDILQNATGTIEYTVTAYDEAGNRNISLPRIVDILLKSEDRTAPVLADMTDVSADAGANVFLVVVVRDNVGIDPATVKVRYSIDNGTAQEHAMTPEINDIFVYQAQTESSDRKIDYTFFAADTSGNAATPLSGYLELLPPVVPLNPDTDGDGMPNIWETANGLNPNLDDAGLDADGDGATNLAEYKWGTDPRDKSSAPPVTVKKVTKAAETPGWLYALLAVLALLIIVALVAGMMLGKASSRSDKDGTVPDDEEEEIPARKTKMSDEEE